MKWLGMVGLVLLLAGCAVHNMRCDGPLQPINAVISAVKATVTQADGAAPQ